MPMLWWWIWLGMWAPRAPQPLTLAPPPPTLWGQSNFDRAPDLVALPTSESDGPEGADESTSEQGWRVSAALTQVRDKLRATVQGNSSMRCDDEMAVHIAGTPARLIRCDGGHEHDGMYGDYELVLLAPGPGPENPGKPKGFVQWERQVNDALSQVVRRRLAPLKGGGVCVETSRSEGPGLFEVMDDTPWRPHQHRVARTAWRFGLQGFEAWPEASGRCPKRGYRDLSPAPDRFEDSVSRHLKRR